MSQPMIFLLAVLLLSPLVFVPPSEAGVESGIINSKHNANKTSEGEEKALNLTGNCECGVFSSPKTKEPEETPILKEVMANVSCGESGDQECLSLCSDKIKVAGERCPATICSAISFADDLKPSVFSRACNSGKWIFTGLTTEKQFCCKEGVIVECKAEKPTKK